MDQSQQWVAEDWKYLAEGNLHLVVSYKGTDTKLLDCILRFNKSHADKEEFHPQSNTLYDRLFQLEFLPEYISVYRQVQFADVEARVKFITEVANRIESDRPVHRRNKYLDSTHPVYIAKNLFYDYSSDQLTCFSCEIKPKTHLPLYSELDTGGCSKFYLVQLQKQTVSEYDPKDLYITKSQKAIEDLMKTPSNNFKLFQHGKEVFQPYKISTARPIDLCNTIHTTIQMDGVLDALKAVFSRNTSTIESILIDWEEIKNVDICQDDLELALSEKPTTDELILKVRRVANFLLMITWSDVSIIGTFIIAQSEMHPEWMSTFKSVDQGDFKIYFKYSVVDYELKPPMKLFEYQKQVTQLSELWSRSKT